jgi:hypothetical protein
MVLAFPELANRFRTALMMTGSSESSVIEITIPTSIDESSQQFALVCDRLTLVNRVCTEALCNKLACFSIETVPVSGQYPTRKRFHPC